MIVVESVMRMKRWDGANDKYWMKKWSTAKENVKKVGMHCMDIMEVHVHDKTKGKMITITICTVFLHMQSRNFNASVL